MKAASHEKSYDPLHDIRGTGIRNYEAITSSDSGSKCKGTVMILRRFVTGNKTKTIYPPSKQAVSKLSYTDIRDKISIYEFFSGLTPEQRKTYLDLYAGDNRDQYLSDIPDLWVKFVSANFYKTVGKNPTFLLEDSVVSQLVRGNPNDPEGFWPMSYVYNLFPRNPGTKAKRHTLMFRPSNWILCPMDNRAKSFFSGFCCYLNTGETAMANVTSERFKIYEFKNVCRCSSNGEVIAVTTDLVDYGEPNLTQLAIEILGTETNNYYSFCNGISIYPPSFLKSLLQKIIRFRPKTVNGIASEVAVIATFVTLYLHAGAFVPDIQRFVSGKESGLKRLAVSIIEDSSIYNTNCLNSLLAAALLTREKIKYTIPIETMRMWLLAAIESVSSENYYNYDTHYTGDIMPSCHSLSYLLSAIGSFGSDIAMVSSISSVTTSGIGLPLLDMDISHAVDQHCYPDIAWFVDPNLIQSYEELFRKIWVNLSSINARKPLAKDETFRQEIEKSQKLFIKSKSVVPVERETTQSKYNFSIILDDSYLAAAVGIFEKGSAYAVIIPNDIHQFNAIRRPTRGCKDHLLDESEYEATISAFKSQLYHGYSVKDELIDAVYYRDGAYYVMKSGILYAWESYRNQFFSLPCHPVIDKTLEMAILTTGSGVEEGANEKILELVNDTKVLARLLLYVEGCKKHIVPYKIGRSGEGVNYTVSPVDTQVYHLLAKICVLYPAALQHSHLSGFEVKHKCLFRYIVENLTLLSTNSFTRGNWSLCKPETRRLYDHQLNAISRLSKRNIIWMDAGMGKTAIVTNHICNLISKGEIPLYCIYTLPPSAIDNIKTEMEMKAIPYKVLTSSDSELVPNAVSIIFHDHLKTIIPRIRENLPSTLVIIDELHKTLNATQRTSAALEIATLSHSFIAMTGTLYKDDKIENLLVWLQLLSKFEVTPKNYWVAISGLISIRCNTRVKVSRIILEEPLTLDEKTKYDTITPAILGGTSMTLNFREAVDISYLAITRRIVSEVINYLNMGEGVFVVGRNATHANLLESELRKMGVNKILVISSSNTMSLNPSSGSPFFPGSNTPYVVITTSNHCEGYDMTLYRVMVSGVYFSNEATREQLEKRINRVNQTSQEVRIILIHAGIISYVHEKYEGVRNMAGALKGFAKDTGIEVSNY